MKLELLWCSVLLKVLEVIKSGGRVVETGGCSVNEVGALSSGFGCIAVCIRQLHP
jgi:hypothetical protein